MKEYTINKNSWHYEFMNSMDYSVPRDLCTYVTKLIWFLF